MTAVSVVGMGRMGRPMSLHLRDAGFQVTAYDVASDANRWAQEQDLRVAGSAKDAAAHADVVLVVTGDEDQVRQATAGRDGVLAGSHPGQVLMLVSTGSPEFARSLARRAEDVGGHLLDSPVCRGERGVREANLLWMVGGRPEDLASCRTVMEACGPRYLPPRPSRLRSSRQGDQQHAPLGGPLRRPRSPRARRAL